MLDREGRWRSHALAWRRSDRCASLSLIMPPRRPLRVIVLIACAATLLGTACELGEDDDEGGEHQQSSSSGSGACTLAGQACGTACAFDPATIDCATACDHLASICAAGACGTLCTPLSQDLSACTTDCEAHKTEHCTNQAYGCDAEATDCPGLEGCLANHP